MKIDCNSFASLGIQNSTIECVLQAEQELNDVFARFDAIEAANQIKVLRAFQEHGIAQRHFVPTTGYGYDDIGRDALDGVFACALDAQDALVRPQIANGTHALFLTLSGLLLPGEKMLSIAGKPYDTLESAIGLCGQVAGSLQEYGIGYEQVDLCMDQIDLETVLKKLADPNIKIVYVQRSRGYAWRQALSLEHLSVAFQAIKDYRKDISIVVDNCYGEFTNTYEPTRIGADVIVGSLIKNPGGGLAPTGGYIAGKKNLIERIANRLTVPGMGREIGSYAASYIPFFQGLFMAPHVTVQSLKSAALFAKVFENFGMVSMPNSTDDRSDIIQAVQFKSEQALIAFCQSIQKAAPIDSFVVPEPWEMPGYSHKVIMAAGAFVQGSSIELSADAPIKAPYIAYIQGALTFAHGRIGVMMAVDALKKMGEIS